MNIWWIRRDLRIEDNQALTAALKEGMGVIPVFILDDRLLAKPAEKRQRFLFAGLRALDADLRRLGSRLIIRQGNPLVELTRLAAECGARSVYAEEDISPYAIRRDTEIGKHFDLQLFQGVSFHPVGTITKENGEPYTVFTPYSRAWKARPFGLQALPAPGRLPPVPEVLSIDLPDTPAPDLFVPGEREGKGRLSAFVDGIIYKYGDGRNRLDMNSTSGISPYLRFGMLSARQAFAAAYQAAEQAPDNNSRLSSHTWINELIWREFYQSILFHFPSVLERAFKPAYRDIPWRNAPEDYHAWQTGLTGYPVVDAGMRQLAETGWMHNRARMITASFLVKHLLINWQEGERWFMERLIDGDPAANNGGWQWIAGTGTDAAPYFRIFNPILQGKKFDPEGAYIRQWIPELESIPQKYIHTPWEMPSNLQRQMSCVIGKDYPAPIVDHEWARQRVLDAYKLGSK